MPVSVHQRAFGRYGLGSPATQLMRAVRAHLWYDLGRKFMEAAHTGMMLLRSPLKGKHRKVGGSQWAGDKLMHWLRFASGDFPLLQQAQREACEDYYQAASAEAWLERLQLEEIRLRWIAELSPLAAEWMPHSSLAPETTLTSLDELLLSLGSTLQEATHVAPG
jgi:Lhr-like helicase